MPNSPREQKPQRVRQAQRFLAAFLAVGFVKMVLDVVPVASSLARSGMWPVPYAIALHVSIFVTVWVVPIYLIFKGNNFGRVAFAILFGAKFLFFALGGWNPPATDAKMPVYSWVCFMVDTTQTLCGIIACVYLLNNEAEAWFKGIKASEQVGGQKV
jgi:hypothetical protein